MVIKKIAKNGLLLIVVVSLLLLSGAYLFAAGQQEGESSKRVEYYTIGGGSPGGNWFTMVGGLTSFLSEQLKNDGMVFTMDSTGGSIDNILRLSAGQTEMAFVHSTHVYQGTNGTGFYDGKKPMDNIMALAEIWPSTFYFVTLEDTGIKALQDLDGKKVAIGAPGSGGAYNATQVLKALDINADTLEIAFDAAAASLRDGRIDALAQSGAPATGIVELDSVEDIVVIPYSDSDLEAIFEIHPYWDKTEMPAGTYEDVKEPVQMWQFSVLLVAREGTSEEIVYKSLERIFSDQGEKVLPTVHPKWKSVNPGFAAIEKAGVKLHPGALQYYQDEGLEIPETLMKK